MEKEQQTKEAVIDFSKGVHDYLGHYIDVADTKAGVVLGLASAFLGFILSQKVCDCLELFLWAGAILEIGAIGICLFALIPRLYTGGKGLIFWDDILSRKTPQTYVQEIEKLSKKDIEDEYAEQNYYLSQILHRKYSAIRWSMIILTLGALVALPILIYKFF